MMISANVEWAKSCEAISFVLHAILNLCSWLRRRRPSLICMMVMEDKVVDVPNHIEVHVEMPQIASVDKVVDASVEKQ